ncbi:MAG TPA: metal ABC transporter substrate-binding protein, partial [Acidimicrobiales bacterium]|nr:metal ABC transporter substrate-binding protein [Acidimicrobiales bacterium]
HGDDDQGDDDHGDDDHAHGDDAHVDDDHGDDDHAHGDDDGHDDHAHGDEDPHFWHDATRMAVAVEAIADALSEVEGIDAAALDARAAELADEYRALDAEIAEIVAVVAEEDRELLTNHDSLGYFADRHGFDVIGVVFTGGSTLSEPSAADIAELVEEIEIHGLRAIFAETTVGTDLAETLAAEVGRDVAVVTLFTGSLGPEGSGAETYPDMMRTNAELIAAALG